MVGRRKDSTKELAKEIQESLTLEEQEGMLALIRAKKGAGVQPDESATGNNGNGQFRESIAKEAPPIVPEQAKIVISQMLGHFDDNLNKSIMTSEVPDHILIHSAITKTREERRDPVYRAAHPNESPKQTALKNLYLHLTARQRKRVKELLNIAELEVDRAHDGNMPFSLGQ